MSGACFFEIPTSLDGLSQFVGTEKVLVRFLCVFHQSGREMSDGQNGSC